jgi:hypothetical protein
MAKLLEASRNASQQAVPALELMAASWTQALLLELEESTAQHRPKLYSLSPFKETRLSRPHSQPHFDNILPDSCMTRAPRAESRRSQDWHTDDVLFDTSFNAASVLRVDDMERS